MSDINGGISPNPNGSPIFPGTTFTGPLLAGNVVHSDGNNTLAGVGETNTGNANVGYCVMSQAQPITQAASTGQSAGVYLTTIVIPAQSQIIGMKLMVTTAWSGASPNLGVGTTASATTLTAAGAVTGSGTLGQQSIVPGTSLTQIANWDNTGNTDIQIVITSTNTGAGVGTFSIEYLQGINQAS